MPIKCNHCEVSFKTGHEYAEHKPCPASRSPGCSIAWSTNKPDQPGWYWLDSKAQIDPVSVVKVVELQRDLRVITGGGYWPGVGVDAFGSHCLWAGPIQEPPKQ